MNNTLTVDKDGLMDDLNKIHDSLTRNLKDLNVSYQSAMQDDSISTQMHLNEEANKKLRKLSVIRELKKTLGTTYGSSSLAQNVVFQVVNKINDCLTRNDPETARFLLHIMHDHSRYQIDI